MYENGHFAEYVQCRPVIISQNRQDILILQCHEEDFSDINMSL